MAARNVSLTIRNRAVLDDITLAIHPGEVHALVAGPNEGKTCLCRILAGRLRPDGGQIDVRGFEGVAMVSGKPQVFPSLSVEDNLIANGSWRLGGRLFARRRRRAFLRGWLAANRVGLDVSAPLHQLPRQEWRFVEIVSHLLRSPRLFIFDEVLDSLSPDRQRELWALFRKSLAAGMAIFWTSGQPEEALAHADRVSVMRWGRILLTEPVGNLDRFNLICLLRNQADAKDGRDDYESARARFRQTMRFTEAILLDIPSGVLIIDSDLKVRFANRSAFELFAVAPLEEAEPDPDLEEFMGEANRRIFSTVGEAAAGGMDGDWHSLPLSAAGRERLIDLRVRIIREGPVGVGHMLILDDVSMREDLRRRLVMSENLASIGLLAAGVAHEVNNPLEVIGNYLSFLKRNSGFGETREALEQIEVETGHIQQIVQNLLAFSGGVSREVSDRTDVARLSRDICSLLSFQGRNRNIGFTVKGAEAPLWAAAPPGEMRLTLLNLIRNSIDAMPAGGRVTVAMEAGSSGEDGGRILLSVSDDGPGIPLERINDVFLPFVSTKGQDSRHQGLGLSIVYGIMENCGGAVSVENQPEGGCRFSLRLPMA
jgi:signal transduction histidine kinase/ABC-type transport system involved in cytochrome c biogenesis ATPase subunit